MELLVRNFREEIFGEKYSESTHVSRKTRETKRARKKRNREREIKPLIRRAQKQRGNNVMHRC